MRMAKKKALSLVEIRAQADLKTMTCTESKRAFRNYI